MGRAMLIICAGVLVSLGIVSISTSNQGKMLNRTTVNYAEYTMAKNAAHTAIQMATQEINKNEDWPNLYPNEDQYWNPTIQGLEVRLHTDFIENDFWETGEQDKLWFYSRAQLGEEFGNNYVEVRSHFQKRPFYELVPDFEGALQLPTDIGNFNVDGAAHEINGIAPHCEENKPPIAVNSQETKDKLEEEDLKKEGGDFEDEDILVDSSLNYEPTDELIERLENSGNAITVNSDFGTNLGTADNPGIFFLEGDVTLTGQQKEGFGILVIRADASMEMDDPELSVAGNFEFNGLIIFENAFAFDGRGTPTINGSVLIGETADHTGDPIDIDLGGDININYDCNGEMYAKMAADQAVQQNKYTLLVSTENLKYGQVPTP